MRHLCFIVNPKAGTDREKELRHLLEHALDKNIFSAEVWHTARAGHGEELARKAAAAGAYSVVAVGGDGSVNDVARGLVGTQTCLGILPKGSGNGLARSLQIPLNLDQAFQCLQTSTPQPLDAGLANGRLFLSNCGTGFDAVIAQAFTQSKSRGLKGYTSLVAQKLTAYRPLSYCLEVDGEQWEQEAFLIAVCNGSQFGYNFQLNPHASVSDGLLDIMLLKPFPKVLAPYIALLARLGKLHQSNYAISRNCKRVRIVQPEMKIFQTDGDAYECPSGELEISIQPGILSVLAPRAHA